MEHKRLWLSPVSASDPHAECACRLILPNPPTTEVNCTFAGQTTPHHLHWISRGRCWQLLGVFHSVESRQRQWESGLRRPDVTGLSKTLWPSSPHTLSWSSLASRLQEPPQGGWFLCVCLYVPEPLRGQVCVCVCVGGSGALGTESGSLLTATVAATLATQEGKCVEWVSGRGMYSRCLCVAGMWLCS